MTDLPPWTNNRLIVGLIIAFITIVVATLQGTLAWHVPMIMGPLFALLITCVLAREKLSSILRTVLAKLPALARIIAKGFLYILATSLVIGTLYGVGMAVSEIARYIRTPSGLEDFMTKYTPSIVPLAFYAVLAMLRQITQPFRVATPTEAFRTELSHIGRELCTISLYTSLMLTLLYSQSSFFLLGHLPSATVFAMVPFNLMLLLISFRLTGALHRIGDPRKALLLSFVNSILGVWALQFTTLLFFRLFTNP